MHTIADYYDYEPHLQELFDASITIREKAYAPHSKFKVGAALLTCTGIIYTGCNVENAFTPLAICAERSAIVRAVCDGQQKFTSIAVCGTFPHKDEFVPPCGLCRQTIIEFATDNNDIAVYLVKPNRGTVLKTTICSLLPLPFKNRRAPYSM